MANEFILNNQQESDTLRIGHQLARVLLPGDVICLLGALGAGKSVMARAIIRHIGDDPTMDVPSPTFPIVQCYDDINPPIHHYDLYRLDETDTGREVTELGWNHSINNAVVLVEWPDRLGGLRPANRLDVLINQTGDDQRQIRLFAHGDDWMARIKQIFGDMA